jgi:hypothetical protein
MAIVATHDDSLIVTRYQTGLSEDGAPITRQKSLAGIKEEATNDDVYEVAQALMSLVEYPLILVRRDNRLILTEE